MNCPPKSRDLQNHTLDSTRWNDVEFRHDDIVIASWAKSGTTWLQQIVGQLVFAGAEGIPVFDISPWVEQRCYPKGQVLETLRKQQHTRFMKTHLPVDALPFSPKARYIFIGRDGRDALWSWRNHHENMKSVVYHMLNETPGRVGPPLQPPAEDPRQYFRDWLERDGFPLWPFWSHIRSWWNVRAMPNVLLMHFNDLKSDLPRAIARVADFLGITVDRRVWHGIVEHCTFQYMKDHASTLSRFLDMGLKGGAHSFIYKGTNSRWQNELTEEDLEAYSRTAVDQLGERCASWLLTGAVPAPAAHREEPEDRVM